MLVVVLKEYFLMMEHAEAAVVLSEQKKNWFFPQKLNYPLGNPTGMN